MEDQRMLLEALGDIADAIRHLTVAVSEAGVGIACDLAALKEEEGG